MTSIVRQEAATIGELALGARATATSRAKGASFADFRDQPRFASLDGLRCASIVAVIWHHSGLRWPWLPLSGHGFLGVDMFFLISGFLIVTLLLRERERTGGIALRRFYIRRSLRIFPAYYGVLAGLAAAMLVLRPGSPSTASYFSDLPYLLTYTANWAAIGATFSIAWSLAAEEQFYLLWPPIEKWLRGWRIMALLIGFIVLNQLVNFRIVDDQLEAWLGLRYAERNMLQTTFTPICLGVLLAHVLHVPAGFRVLARALGARWSSPVIALLLLIACNLSGDLAGWPRLLIQLCMGVLLCSCVIREDHALRPALAFPILRRLGEISYGMYLFHMLALHVAIVLIAQLGWEPPLLRFAVTLAVTIAAAEVSFRWFESPFLRLKERFRDASADTQTAVTSTA